MKKIENNSKELKSSLMNKALSYLSKFSTTESKLRSNLNSYSEKFFSEIRKELLQSEINSVLKRCKELGYINDETFAKNKIEKFINSGKSKKFTRAISWSPLHSLYRRFIWRANLEKDR